MLSKDIAIKFTHPIDDSKFLLYKLSACPESYLKGVERDDFFEMIWFWDPDDHEAQNAAAVYLVPPFRSLDIPLADKEGYLIAFKREYLEEDDKEYALDVFNLFNHQGQYSLLPIGAATQENFQHVYALMADELKNPLGTYLVLKALLKVILLHLIRITQNAFLNQDVNQKRVYECCILLDRFYIPERKASFYAGEIGISEKRLNQILQEKMNKTITQLIHARLILEAKRKLITGELTIKEISFYLKFEDPSYFSRFFKKQTGISPEDFKKGGQIV